MTTNDIIRITPEQIEALNQPVRRRPVTRQRTHKYRVEASGSFLGYYFGRSPQDALDSFARTAGRRSFAEMQALHVRASLAF